MTAFSESSVESVPPGVWQRLRRQRTKFSAHQRDRVGQRDRAVRADDNAVSGRSRTASQSKAPGGISPPATVCLLLLTITAAVLRLVESNTCLWIDEINCLRAAIRPPLAEIVTTFQGDIQHPLYCVLASLSIGSLGESPWTLRLPAIIFGVITIPMIYRLALIYATRIEALLVAALVTFSYHHVWFSQDARGYTALLFWTLLGTCLMHQGITLGRKRYFVGFAIVAALGTYTHLSMAMVTLGQGVACGVFLLTSGRNIFRDRWLPVAWSLCLGGILTLILYSPMLLEIVRFFNAPSKMEGTSTPLWAVMEAIRAFQFGFDGLAGALLFAILAAGAFVVGCGIRDLWRTDRLFLLLITVPVVLTGIGIVLTRGTLYPRYVFFGLGFGVIIGVRGVLVIGDLFARTILAKRYSTSAGMWMGASFAVLVIGASAATVPRNYRFPKQDFAGALGFIEARRSPEDQVATLGAARWAYLDYYERPWALVETREELIGLLRDNQRTWVVYTFESYIAPELIETIHERFELQKKLPGTLGNGEVYVYLAHPL